MVQTETKVLLLFIPAIRQHTDDGSDRDQSVVVVYSSNTSTHRLWFRQRPKCCCCLFQQYVNTQMMVQTETKVLLLFIPAIRQHTDDGSDRDQSVVVVYSSNTSTHR